TVRLSVVSAIRDRSWLFLVAPVSDRSPKPPMSRAYRQRPRRRSELRRATWMPAPLPPLHHSTALRLQSRIAPPSRRQPPPAPPGPAGSPPPPTTPETGTHARHAAAPHPQFPRCAPPHPPRRRPAAPRSARGTSAAPHASRRPSHSAPAPTHPQTL